MKKYLCFILCVLVAGAYVPCEAKKKKQKTEYTDAFAGGVQETPCAVFDDANYFASTGYAYGDATDKSQLQIDALQSAQEAINNILSHAVIGEINTHREKINKSQSKRIEDGFKNIVQDVLNDAEVCCTPKFSGVDEKGNQFCYIAIRIPKAEFMAKLRGEVEKNAKEEERKSASDFFERLEKDIQNQSGN